MDRGNTHLEHLFRDDSSAKNHRYRANPPALAQVVREKIVGDKKTLWKIKKQSARRPLQSLLCSFKHLGVNNPVSKGNPTLRPETVRTLESAVFWQAAPTLQLNANLFIYRMQDQIVATKNPVGPASFYTYQNVGEQRGIGGECEAVWDATRSVRLTASYSRQRSRDAANDVDAGYAPHNQIYVRGDWRFMGGWLASTQINWIDARERAFGDARTKLDGYTAVDVTLRTERRKTGWEFAASIRNLFDQQILEPSFAPGTTYPYDLPQPRRSMYLQATYAL